MCDEKMWRRGEAVAVAVEKGGINDIIIEIGALLLIKCDNISICCGKSNRTYEEFLCHWKYYYYCYFEPPSTTAHEDDLDAMIPTYYYYDSAIILPLFRAARRFNYVQILLVIRLSSELATTYYYMGEGLKISATPLHRLLHSLLTPTNRVEWSKEVAWHL